MPDPALLSGMKYPVSGMPDTKEEFHVKFFKICFKYHCISQNQIMCPPGHIQSDKVYFNGRKKLKHDFLRSFFCAFKIGCQFFLALPQGKERKAVWQNEKSESGLEKWKHGWRLRKRNIRNITVHGGSRKSGSRGTGK